MSTDVTGYRSSDTTLGGGGANVSDQLRKILTNKLPLLNSPGTVIENSIYYDVTSSSVSAVEMQETFAKDRINMSTTIFGSAPTAYIPSVLFAGNVYLVGTLPNISYPTPASATDKFSSLDKDCEFYAPEGWLFNCIQSVIVYMGACSIAQIEIDGWSNFMIAMACCETEKKRKSMLVAAGQYLYNFSGTSPGIHTIMAAINGDLKEKRINFGDSSLNPSNSIFILNSNYTKNYTITRPGADAWSNVCYYPMATAIAPIRLPFSSMAALERKLSFDTKLSTQPIQVTIQLRNFRECFHAGSKLGNLSTPQFSSLALELWQEELSDKSLSVRNELLAMPQFNVGYPFQYTQSIPFPFPTSDQGLGQVTFGGNAYNSTQITMNITSIINSDLTTMLFMVSQQGRSSTAAQNVTTTYTPSSGGATTVTSNMNQFCPLYGEKLTNMQLYLNGQRFFAFEQDIYDGASICKQLDTTLTPVVIPYPGLTSDGKSTGFGSGSLEFVHGESCIYELNMSRLRSIVCESHMQNTARFTNQTFQLTFNVERTLLYPPGLSTTQYANCVLHMAYLYNAVILIGGDGGTSKLVTN